MADNEKILTFRLVLDSSPLQAATDAATDKVSKAFTQMFNQVAKGWQSLPATVQAAIEQMGKQVSSSVSSSMVLVAASFQNAANQSANAFTSAATSIQSSIRGLAQSIFANNLAMAQNFQTLATQIQTSFSGAMASMQQAMAANTRAVALNIGLMRIEFQSMAAAMATASQTMANQVSGAVNALTAQMGSLRQTTQGTGGSFLNLGMFARQFAATAFALFVVGPILHSITGAIEGMINAFKRAVQVTIELSEAFQRQRITLAAVLASTENFGGAAVQNFQRAMLAARGLQLELASLSARSLATPEQLLVGLQAGQLAGLRNMVKSRQEELEIVRRLVDLDIIRHNGTINDQRLNSDITQIMHGQFRATNMLAQTLVGIEPNLKRIVAHSKDAHDLFQKLGPALDQTARASDHLANTLTGMLNTAKGFFQVMIGLTQEQGFFKDFTQTIAKARDMMADVLEQLSRLKNAADASTLLRDVARLFITWDAILRQVWGIVKDIFGEVGRGSNVLEIIQRLLNAVLNIVKFVREALQTWLPLIIQAGYTFAVMAQQTLPTMLFILQKMAPWINGLAIGAGLFASGMDGAAAAALGLWTALRSGNNVMEDAKQFAADLRNQLAEANLGTPEEIDKQTQKWLESVAKVLKALDGIRSNARNINEENIKGQRLVDSLQSRYEQVLFQHNKILLVLAEQNRHTRDIERNADLSARQRAVALDLVQRIAAVERSNIISDSMKRVLDEFQRQSAHNDRLAQIEQQRVRTVRELEIALRGATPELSKQLEIVNRTFVLQRQNAIQDAMQKLNDQLVQTVGHATRIDEANAAFAKRMEEISKLGVTIDMPEFGPLLAQAQQILAVTREMARNEFLVKEQREAALMATGKLRADLERVVRLTQEAARAGFETGQGFDARVANALMAGIRQIVQDSETLKKINPEVVRSFLAQAEALVKVRGNAEDVYKILFDMIGLMKGQPILDPIGAALKSAKENVERVKDIFSSIHAQMRVGIVPQFEIKKLLDQAPALKAALERDLVRLAQQIGDIQVRLPKLDPVSKEYADLVDKLRQLEAAYRATKIELISFDQQQRELARQFTSGISGAAAAMIKHLETARKEARLSGKEINEAALIARDGMLVAGQAVGYLMEAWIAGHKTMREAALCAFGQILGGLATLVQGYAAAWAVACLGGDLSKCAAAAAAYAAIGVLQGLQGALCASGGGRSGGGGAAGGGVPQQTTFFYRPDNPAQSDLNLWMRRMHEEQRRTNDALSQLRTASPGDVVTMGAPNAGRAILTAAHNEARYNQMAASDFGRTLLGEH